MCPLTLLWVSLTPKQPIPAPSKCIGSICGKVSRMKLPAWDGERFGIRPLESVCVCDRSRAWKTCCRGTEGLLPWLCPICLLSVSIHAGHVQRIFEHSFELFAYRNQRCFLLFWNVLFFFMASGLTQDDCAILPRFWHKFCLHDSTEIGLIFSSTVRICHVTISSSQRAHDTKWCGFLISLTFFVSREREAESGPVFTSPRFI